MVKADNATKCNLHISQTFHSYSTIFNSASNTAIQRGAKITDSVDAKRVEYLTRSYTDVLTCPCGSVVNAPGRHVPWSVTRLGSRVQSLVWGVSAFHQRIISNNSDAYDEQGDNHRQK